MGTWPALSVSTVLDRVPFASTRRFPGRVWPVPLMPEMLSHFLIERSFQHPVSDQREQPIWAVSDSPCSLASRTNPAAACSSADGSTFGFLATTSSVVITAPFPPDNPPSVSGQTPITAQSRQ